MKHLDLFSGIGGFALSARWAGFETVQFVEIDKFCQKVLAKNFPGVPVHDDIKSFRGDRYRGVDLLTAGWPCQPFSIAGQRKGREDDRDLWGEVLRVVQECKPTWIVGENVANFINMEFDRSATDLESEGYEVQAVIIPACGVNAPHRRDRVWIMAHSRYRNGQRAKDARQLVARDRPRPTSEPQRSDSWNELRATPDTDNAGLQEQRLQQSARSQLATFERADWREVEPCLRGGDTRLPRRVERLKALGNSIVPQVAYQILKGIADMEVAR